MFSYSIAMKKLQRLRKRKGYSLRGLAKAAGVHWTTIWKIEDGRHVSTLPTLKKLAKALGVKVADLL